MKSFCVPVVLSLVLVLLLDQAPSARADSLSKEQVESAVDEALDKLNKQQVSTCKLALAEEQDIQVSFNVSISNFTDVDTKSNLDKMIKYSNSCFSHRQTKQTLKDRQTSNLPWLRPSAMRTIPRTGPIVLSRRTRHR